MPSSFPFSNRTDWELSSNPLTSLLDELRNKKIPILDLTQSNPTRCEFFYPQQLLRAFNTSENLKYTPDSKGLLAAREAVRDYYTRHDTTAIDSEKIILTSSTSEAYAFLFRLLANPGDKILIPAPSYPLFQYLVGLNDAQMSFYPLKLIDNRWSVDVAALEKQMDENTRVLVLVSPNNPTGCYIKKKELEAINGLCKKFKTAILCDEVFFDYSFQKDNNEITSLINNKEVLTFVLGGLSKSFALPQMKISWIIPSGPVQDLKEAVSRLEIIADTFLSVNTPVQNALPAWLALHTTIHSSIYDRVRHNHDWLMERAKNNPRIRAIPSEGGWYVVVQIPTHKTEEEWCMELLQKDHVLVHPGYFFDFDHEAYIVLSLLPPSEIFEKGLEHILARIDQQ